MRLLFVTASDLSDGSPVGGAETSILLVAKLLARAGHRVTVLFRHDHRTTTPFPSITDRSGVRRIGLRRQRQAPPSLLLSVVGRLNAHDRIHRLAIRRLVSKADVVYSDYRLDAMEWVDAARRRASTPPPWIIRIAGVHPALVSAAKPDKRARYETVFGNATALNFLHPASQRLFESLASDAGLRLPKGRAILWDIGTEAGLRIDRVGLRSAASDAGQFRLVMVGRLVGYQKRQDLLIEALARVRSDVSLTFIGQGPTRERLEELAAARGVAERVRFHDQLPQEELWSFLAGFHLQCIATDFEGMPKIVLESMAVGLPVLASKVTPMDQLIVDGVDGFLVDNDPDSWARAIDRLAEDRSALASVISPARIKVHEQFQPRQQADRLISIFEELRRDAAVSGGERQ